ncbi:transposase [Aliarcobacter cryaerophilus ATCC 43158]|uniref:Transposition-related ATP-binding protein TniB n=1 Tax=Aliarcobacter cryaerophilus ATCC 43158 TaxID=1032070 RepID=A0AAD0TS59_9BACT|nr:TniB family NTP-binding protein [Aliarcobacter cryaerophilus]AYJ79353.1 transposition-related ATP-binding protein TniB [Aliarcobacter cryaerophilus ATCC 43158]PRM98006.1 transposase [Aliarcobacter cryaerophilus]QCZ23614.1 transposase [Aliarcobacter cryaerophilus ATCC 43158]
MNGMALTNEAQQIINKTNSERITYISEDRWVHYPQAEEIIQTLESIKTYEKNKTRVTSILLVGSSNNGKTSLLEEFVRRNPSYDYYSENSDKLTKEFFDNYNAIGIPALSILAPNEPNESRLYSNILNKIFAPFNERDSVARKQYLVQYYLNLLNVDMLIIDEIHNILSGSIAKQKQVLNAIKNLSNHLKIPIVLSGTKDALRAVSTDTQISSRFRPIYLRKWKMDKEFVSLLATFIKTLPLKKESIILTSNTAMEILEISDGNIGDIVGLLKKAAIYAIKSESERITLKEIRECDYISMSNVKKIVELSEI